MTTILAGTTEGLLEIEKGAARPDERAQLGGREVTALARDADRIWAVVDGTTLWRRDAAGRWAEVASSPKWPITSLAVTPAGLLAGTAEAHLLRLEGPDLVVVESFDEIEGRDGWYTPWGGPPDTRSISGGRAGVFVNVHVGGILKAEQTAWRQTMDIDADVHQVLVHPDGGEVVVAATARGLAVSTDAGATWRFTADGLHAPYCRAVAVAGSTIFVTASDGPRGRRSLVYRGSLESIDPALEPCAEGLPGSFDGNVDTGWLVAGAGIAVLAAPDGVVYASEDDGLTWGALATGLPPVRCLALA